MPYFTKVGHLEKRNDGRKSDRNGLNSVYTAVSSLPLHCRDYSSGEATHASYSRFFIQAPFPFYKRKLYELWTELTVGHNPAKARGNMAISSPPTSLYAAPKEIWLVDGRDSTPSFTRFSLLLIWGISWLREHER